MLAQVDARYECQTIRDNVSLLTPDLLSAVGRLGGGEPPQAGATSPMPFLMIPCRVGTLRGTPGNAGRVVQSEQRSEAEASAADDNTGFARNGSTTSCCPRGSPFRSAPSLIVSGSSTSFTSWRVALTAFHGRPPTR